MNGLVILIRIYKKKIIIWIRMNTK